MLVSTVFARPAALPSLPNNDYATSRQRSQPTDADPGTAPGPRYGTIQVSLDVARTDAPQHASDPPSGVKQRREMTHKLLL